MPGAFTLSFFPAIVLALLAASPVAAAQNGASGCALEGQPGERVVAVVEGFELLLEDGRRVQPAGIDPPAATRDDPQFGAHGRQALAARLVGTMIEGPPAGAPPDRWGRVIGPIFAEAPVGAAPGDVAAMIVATGAARVRPDAAAGACMPSLLRAEALARQARLGLWADPAYAVLSADAPDTFVGRFGTLQIVEGRVTSIGESGPFSYLNFGPRRGVDFTVVIARQNSKAFERAGLPLHGVLGRRVRVRGFLDKASGPQIEISAPDWLEMIEGK